MSPSRVISRCSRSLASTYPRSSASGSVWAAHRRITSRSPSTRTCWAVWTRNASFVSFAGSARASRRCSVVGPSWARIFACSTVTRPSATAADVSGRWSRSVRPRRTCARAVWTARWCCSATQSANDFDPPAAHIPSASTTGNRHAPRAVDRPAPAASAPATTCACGPSRSRAPTAALIASIDAMYALTAAASAGGSTATSTPAHGSKAAGRSISSLIRPTSSHVSRRIRSASPRRPAVLEMLSPSRLDRATDTPPMSPGRWGNELDKPTRRSGRQWRRRTSPETSALTLLAGCCAVSHARAGAGEPGARHVAPAGNGARRQPRPRRRVATGLGEPGARWERRPIRTGRGRIRRAHYADEP